MEHSTGIIDVLNHPLSINIQQVFYLTNQQLQYICLPVC